MFSAYHVCNCVAPLLLLSLVAGVAVFFLSLVAHMVFKYHDSDYKGIEDKASEKRLREAVRAEIPYKETFMVPHCGGKHDEEAMKNFQTGPAFILTMVDNSPGFMSRALTISFIYNIASCFATFLVLHASEVREEQKRFFLAAFVGFLANGGAAGWDVGASAL